MAKPYLSDVCSDFKRNVEKKLSRDGIFKLLTSPEIDSKESIPSAYVDVYVCIKYNTVE
jgi:hypothetical protein